MFDTLIITIDVPKEYRKHWPKERGGGDTTPPHFTLLFIGECDDKEVGIIKDCVKLVSSTTKPFDIRLNKKVSWFTSKDESQEESEIAHKKPDKQSEKKMSTLYKDLRELIEKVLKRKVAHWDGSFLAHSTLKYCKDRNFKHDMPALEWEVNEINLSGKGINKKYRLGTSL